MSNYVKATNFATKDTLPTGDANKIVKGTEIDNEFNAIAGAISSKADLSSPSLTGTPTVPTASAGTNTNQIASCSFAINNGVPSGCILIWSGSIASIPSGWVLCDGTNGTPNLRNRFVVGAGSTYAVAATGGSADAVVVSHTHGATSSVSDPGHTHGLENVVSRYGYGSSFGVRGDYAVPPADVTTSTGSRTTGISVSTSITTVGSSATNANLPPYYALAYIMKS